MAYANGGDNLSKFLDMGQKILQKTHGINAQSLNTLANLANRLQLSADEMNAAGAQLGLNSVEVKQVIRDGQLAGGAGGGSAVRWVLALGSLAIVLGVGGGVAFFLLNQKPEGQGNQHAAQTTGTTNSTTNTGGNGGPANTDTKPTNPTGTKPGDKGTTGKPAVNPFLTDSELLLVLSRAQKQLPADQVLLEYLKFSDPATRAGCWKHFLAKVPDLATQKESLRPLLAAYHAKEDSEDNAKLIRAQLMKMLPPNIPGVPDKALVYENAFWATEAVLDAIQHAALAADRKAKLQTELEGALQTKLAGVAVADLKKHCGKALSELFFGELIKSAKKEPDKVAKLQESLTAQALTYLGINRYSDLDGQLKVALKEAKAPPTPPNPNPNPKPNPDPNPKPADPPAPKADARLEKLTNTAAVLLKKNQPPTGEPVKVLQDSVNLAYAATLAVALAHKKEAKFDELANNPPSLADYLAKVKPPEKKPDPPPQTNPGGDPPGGAAGFGGNPPGGAAGFGGNPPGGAVGFMGNPPGGAVGFAGNPPGGAVGFMGNPPGGAVGFMGNPPGGAVGFGGNPPGGAIGFKGGPPGGAVGFGGNPPGGAVGFKGNPPGGAVGFGGNPPGGAVGFMGNPPGGAVGFGGNPPGGAVGFMGNPPGGAVGFGGNPPGGAVGFMGNPPGGNGGNPGGGVNGNPSNPPADNTPPVADPEMLALAFKALKMDKVSPVLRYKALEYIALAYNEPDLSPNEGETIADYLLKIQNIQEFEAAIPVMVKLGRFKAVHLAVADRVADANMQLNRLEIIASALTGKQANLGKEKDWRKAAKVLLLHTVLNMAEGLPEGDAVQLLLRDLYHKQATVMGLDVSANITRPSGVLEKMITHVADDLGKKMPAGEATKKFLSGIPKKMLAIKYLSGGNDIQETVLLQRLWLDVLAEKLSLEQPARAKQARDLCLELDGLCHKQTDALAQMWLCDNYLLRMWLLHLEPPAPVKKG